MQKFLFKIHFGHKNFIYEPIFKMFTGPIRTNLDQDTDKKIFSSHQTVEKFSPEVEYQTSGFTHYWLSDVY